MIRCSLKRRRVAQVQLSAAALCDVWVLRQRPDLGRLDSSQSLTYTGCVTPPLRGRDTQTHGRVTHSPHTHRTKSQTGLFFKCHPTPRQLTRRPSRSRSPSRPPRTRREPPAPASACKRPRGHRVRRTEDARTIKTRCNPDRCRVPAGLHSPSPWWTHESSICKDAGPVGITARCRLEARQPPLFDLVALLRARVLLVHSTRGAMPQSSVARASNPRCVSPGAAACCRRAPQDTSGTVAA